jgi:hypothetical protein
MCHKLVRALSALLLFALVLIPLAVSAHETVTAGDYAIEYGWLVEPAVAGQPNAIVINVGNAGASEPDKGAISLVAPIEGAMIHGDAVAVTVKFDGLDEHAGDKGIHWHLYLDDHMLAMIPLHQTTITVTGLTDGHHTLKASLSNASHADMDEPATAAITIEGASETGSPSVSGLEATLDSHGAGVFAEVDVSQLTVEIIYGGESKRLALQPLGANTPGQFIAPLTPTRAGEYTVRLTGKISDSDVNVEVSPEEVQTTDVLQFPSAAVESPKPTNTFGLSGWLAVAGVILGLLGTGLGVAALQRKK